MISIEILYSAIGGLISLCGFLAWSLWTASNKTNDNINKTNKEVFDKIFFKLDDLTNSIHLNDNNLRLELQNLSIRVTRLEERVKTRRKDDV